MSLDLEIKSFSFLFITSLVYRKVKKMELMLHQVLYLYDVFLENDGSENCAKVLEEEFNKMCGINL